MFISFSLHTNGHCPSIQFSFFNVTGTKKKMCCLFKIFYWFLSRCYLWIYVTIQNNIRFILKKPQHQHIIFHIFFFIFIKQIYIYVYSSAKQTQRKRKKQFIEIETHDNDEYVCALLDIVVLFADRFSLSQQKYF